MPASREVIEAEVAGLFQRVMAEARTERVVTESLTRAAFHEAGHAVVVLLRGYPLVEVRIDTARLGAGETRAHASVDVALLSAGVVAEHRFLGDVGDGCGDDEARALEALDGGEVAIGGEVAWARDVIDAYAPAVRAVAAALLEYGHLSGGDVEAIVRAAQTAEAIDAGQADIPPGTGYPDGMEQDSLDAVVARWQAKIAALADSASPADKGMAAQLQRDLDELLSLLVQHGRAGAWGGEHRFAGPVDRDAMAQWWAWYSRGDADERLWPREAIDAAYRMHLAAEAGDWSAHRRWQGRLVEVQRPLHDYSRTATAGPVSAARIAAVHAAERSAGGAIREYAWHPRGDDEVIL